MRHEDRRSRAHHAPQLSPGGVLLTADPATSTWPARASTIRGPSPGSLATPSSTRTSP
ncbi:hypothetical protein NKG05_18910 [Oerskovia sp. M15]